MDQHEVVTPTKHGHCGLVYQKITEEHGTKIHLFGLGQSAKHQCWRERSAVVQKNKFTKKHGYVTASVLLMS